MKSVFEIVKKPIVTEKSNKALEMYNEITLEVDIKSTKPLIKKAVEALFGVSVLEVRTMIVPGKAKQKGRIKIKHPNWKKAIVRLAPGNSIDFYNLGVS